MTLAEMYDAIKKIHAEVEGEYEYIGVRFENKDRNVGDKCEWSKHNPDRLDERDFPEYGSEEYDSLPELKGTSVWDIKRFSFTYEPWESPEDDAKRRHFTEHAYIVAGNYQGTHDDPDDGEILIKDAVVVAKLY